MSDDEESGKNALSLLAGYSSDESENEGGHKEKDDDTVETVKLPPRPKSPPKKALPPPDLMFNNVKTPKFLGDALAPKSDVQLHHERQMQLARSKAFVKAEAAVGESRKHAMAMSSGRPSKQQKTEAEEKSGAAPQLQEGVEMNLPPELAIAMANRKLPSNKPGLINPTKVNMYTAKNDPAQAKKYDIKERVKGQRLKGQSAHSTWKSEGEMLLRQQYD